MQNFFFFFCTERKDTISSCHFLNYGGPMSHQVFTLLVSNTFNDRKDYFNEKFQWHHRGIEPATFRRVASTNCATAYPCAVCQKNQKHICCSVKCSVSTTDFEIFEQELWRCGRNSLVWYSCSASWITVRLPLFPIRTGTAKLKFPPGQYTKYKLHV